MPSPHLGFAAFLRVRPWTVAALALRASLVVCAQAWAGQAAIASAHPLATAAGEEMLRK